MSTDTPRRVGLFSLVHEKGWLHSLPLAALGWSGASYALHEATRYLRVIVLARLLAPQDFGVFGIAMFLLNLLEAFTQPGWTTALIQTPQDVTRYLDSVFLANALRGLLLACGICVLAPAAATFWNVPESTGVLTAMAGVVALRGFINPAAVWLHRQLDFRPFFIWTCIESVTSLGVGVFLAWRGLGPWALVGSLLASELVATALSYWVKPWRPQWRVSWHALGELTRFTRWVVASNAVTFLGLQLETAVVAKLIGPAALGIYQVADRVASAARGAIGVLGQVAYPAMSAAQGNHAKLKRLFFSFWFPGLAVAGGYAVTILLFARPIVQGLLGERWTRAAPLAGILSLGHFLRCASFIPSYYFLAIGRPQVTFGMAAARASTLAASLWPFTMSWNAEGAAWASVLAASVMNAVWIVAMCRGTRWGRVRLSTPAEQIHYAESFALQQMPQEAIGVEGRRSSA